MQVSLPFFNTAKYKSKIPISVRLVFASARYFQIIWHLTDCSRVACAGHCFSFKTQVWHSPKSEQYFMALWQASHKFNISKPKNIITRQPSEAVPQYFELNANTLMQTVLRCLYKWQVAGKMFTMLTILV